MQISGKVRLSFFLSMSSAFVPLMEFLDGYTGTSEEKKAGQKRYFVGKAR